MGAMALAVAAVAIIACNKEKEAKRYYGVFHCSGQID